MPRNNLSTELLGQRSIRLIDLVRIDLPNEILRFTDAEADISSTLIDGSTAEVFLTGQGYLGHDPVPFTSQINANRIELTFQSAILDSAAEPIARKLLNNSITGGTVWLIKRIITDTDVGITSVSNGTDFILFKGLIDNVAYKATAKDSVLKLFCGGPFANFDRVALYGYTNLTSQQKKYPTDTGFQYSTKNVKNIKWEE